MNAKSPFNSLLVPTDFSPLAEEAFQWSRKAVDANESVIIVLHVLDESLIELVATHEFAAREQVVQQLRSAAESQLAKYRDAVAPGVEIDTMIVEGRPFLEIIRKAHDFAVDAIVMGKVGRRGHVEKLLFGSTAEKVLRGADLPVIALPPPRA
jgi:nucleotide-binding universal stress UspA family protein